MLWHYTCPECHRPALIDWARHEDETSCFECGAAHYPPTPHEDHYAWVDGPEWPPEMREAVTTIRGTICAVTGCYREHTTLVHRVPLSRDGKTSVDNLMPLCEKHAQTKGERDWDEWLAEVRKQQQADQPKMEITITARQPEPAPVESFFAAPSGQAQSIVAMTEAEAARFFGSDPGSAPRLLFGVPFLRGTATRLTVDYDWQTLASGRTRLFLLAWPRGERLDIVPLGGPKFVGLYSVKEHLGVADEHGSAEIELFLPDKPRGRWNAGLAVIDEGGKLRLGDFVLAAVT